MDATYNTNQLGLVLTVLNGISSEGKNLIMGFALLAKETTENYQWLLRQLRDMNQQLEPKVIMTDFEASICQAIELEY